MFDQASSKPSSNVQSPAAIASVLKKGTSACASTFVALVNLTIRALPNPLLTSINWSTIAWVKKLAPAVRVIVSSVPLGVMVVVPCVLDFVN